MSLSSEASTAESSGMFLSRSSSFNNNDKAEGNKPLRPSLVNININNIN